MPPPAPPPSPQERIQASAAQSAEAEASSRRQLEEYVSEVQGARKVVAEAEAGRAQAQKQEAEAVAQVRRVCGVCVEGRYMLMACSSAGGEGRVALTAQRDSSGSSTGCTS